MDTDKIHRAADKARQSAERASARKKARRGPKPPQPATADSRQVFHRIYPYEPNRAYWIFLPLFAVVIGCVMMLSSWEQNAWVLPYTLGVALIPIVVFLLIRAKEAWDYPAYKAWCKQPPFPILGWNRLGQSGNFPRDLYWDDAVTVTVQVSSKATPETLRLIEDLLYLFCRIANGEFYAAEMNQPGRVGDTRKKWKPTGELVISGSADGCVMGKMYAFLRKQLGALHQKAYHIAAVQLDYSGNVYKIEPEQVGD